MLQLLCLGDVLLSLGSDNQLILWNVGQYEPQVCGKGALLSGSPLNGEGMLQGIVSMVQ